MEEFKWNILNVMLLYFIENPFEQIDTALRNDEHCRTWFQIFLCKGPKSCARFIRFHTDSINGNQKSNCFILKCQIRTKEKAQDSLYKESVWNPKNLEPDFSLLQRNLWNLVCYLKPADFPSDQNESIWNSLYFLVKRMNLGDGIKHGKTRSLKIVYENQKICFERPNIMYKTFIHIPSLKNL